MGMPPPPTPTSSSRLLPRDLQYESNYTHTSPGNGAGVNSDGPGTPYAGGEVPGDDPNFFFSGYEDWLALPLDPIVGAGIGGVTQSQMGPDVGGVDLLELLLGGAGGG